MRFYPQSAVIPPLSAAYHMLTVLSSKVAYTDTGTFDIMTITVSFRSYVVLCVIDSAYVCLYTHKVFASTIQPLAYVCVPGHHLIIVSNT